MSFFQIAMAMWQPEAHIAKTQVFASVVLQSGSAAGDCVRFGFHSDTLQGNTCKVNGNCGKMLYRTKIGREVSGMRRERFW